MNDLLSSIGQRRNQLLTELPGSEAENGDIEQMLDALEEQLSNAIAQKQGNQDIIDQYRQQLQAINNWFDNMAKRSEAVDKGSGLTCNQKQNAICELQNEFEDQGPKKVDGVKQLAAQVTDFVNNLDSQQIEEQVRILFIFSLAICSVLQKIEFQKHTT